MYGPSLLLESITPPWPVTVHVDVWGRWLPNPIGKRNCFSAEQKWLEAPAIILLAPPLSINIAPRLNASPIVEQAPKILNRGILKFLTPKVEPQHWFNKSPVTI